MKKLLISLLLFSTTAFGVNKIIKAPSGQVVIGSQANVRASEGAGTTTLVNSDAREQIFNLSAARTVKLPSTGIKAGELWIFKNVATATSAILTIQSSGANTLGYNNSADAKVSCVALQDTPTSAAHWQCFMDFSPRQYLCDKSGGANDITYNNSTKATLYSNSGMDVVQFCYLYPYQTLGGAWRLRFNISYNILGGGTYVLGNITGVTTKNCGGTCNQVITAYQVDSGAYATTIAITGTNGPTIAALTYSNTVTQPRISGDIELNSKPTWAY